MIRLKRNLMLEKDALVYESSLINGNIRDYQWNKLFQLPVPNLKLNYLTCLTKDYGTGKFIISSTVSAYPLSPKVALIPPES
ncbi:hypothetical protein J2787_000954 [Chryseobacterium rhizosphaerae]|uniref:Uncharacterized protein n=1 Tax=Chryseobacterium rhizosphaerae TaxID=395937 RepID=A0AAE3Y7Y9_9FLAO|nr:hypothetical protein [Chryseobacterium rhizosphaerae]